MGSVVYAIAALAALGQGSKSFDLTVQGEVRHALCYYGSRAAAEASPLVLAFHAHGSTANSASRLYKLHKDWPEATVAYLQGLPTSGTRDPDGTRAGWQINLGDQYDRDFRYVDAALQYIAKKVKVDPKRVFAAGVDEGGRFALLLWADRPDVFAGVVAGGCRVGTRGLDKVLSPKPVLYFAGEKDAVLPLAESGRERDRLLAANHASSPPAPQVGASVYPAAPGGAPVWWLQHDGGHIWPSKQNAAVVAFLKAVGG